LFDLTLYHYNFQNGEEHPDLIGVHAAMPPRRPARGREGDQLVLVLHQESGSSLEKAAQTDILQKLSDFYYNSRGTVTSALRGVFDQLNDRLLARNMRPNREGAPIIASLNAAVFRADMVFLAQSGSAHAFVLGKDKTAHFGESVFQGRGLGATRSVIVRYERIAVQPENYLLLGTNPLASWTEEALAGAGKLGLDALRRRLLTQNKANLKFVVIKVQAGKGAVRVSPLPGQGNIPAPTVLAAGIDSEKAVQLPTEPVIPEPGQLPAVVELPIKTTQAEGEKPTQAQPEITGEILGGGVVRSSERPRRGRLTLFGKNRSNRRTRKATERSPLAEPSETPFATTIDGLEDKEAEPWSPEQGEPDFSKETLTTTINSQSVADNRVQKPILSPRVRKGLAKGYRRLQFFRQKSESIMGEALPRVLPGDGQRQPGLSTASMIFIAIAVPVLIVAAATTVYIRNGRGDQHRMWVAQAQTAVSQAINQTDETLIRINYEAALERLEKAETYGQSDESIALRVSIGAALDDLDGIQRVALNVALAGGFDTTIRITRIVTSPSEDLYLLDGNTGRVIRLVYTRPGYEVDPQFQCMPGIIGGLIIGPLVDISPAPTNNRFDAVVFGVDAAGNLMFCSLAEKDNLSAFALTPPDAGWGSLDGISYESGILLVLDQKSNAVWRYEASNLEFMNPPRLFFDNEVPNLASAIDLILYQDDLYVLNSDGHMLQCTYSNVSTTPTRCTDPALYHIVLPGQASEELTTLEGSLLQFQATQPPEPALFFLEGSNPALYEFSYSLNYVQQLRFSGKTGVSLPDRAPTAFAVTPGRNLILAYDNLFYSVPLP
jgi:hypothetical protein